MRGSGGQGQADAQQARRLALGACWSRPRRHDQQRRLGKAAIGFALDGLGVELTPLTPAWPGDAEAQFIATRHRLSSRATRD